MTRDLFEKKLQEAIEKIPKEFKEKMENVEIILEDFPDQEIMESMGIYSKWNLLGLYVGVPLSHQSFFASNTFPERIHIYKRPILRANGGVENLEYAIRDVLIHEIGHHFGFDDEQLEEMEGPQA